MAITKKFPTYPNYSFLQLEEINQTILNFSSEPFREWSCINTEHIYSKYTNTLNKTFRDLRYNFTIIKCVKSGSVYTWTFEVRNVFWTGKYKLLNVDGSVYTGSYEVSTSDSGGNFITISGNNFNHFILCLELSNVDQQRDIESTVITFEGEVEYTHQFDNSSYEYLKVINAETKQPIVGATVKLIPLDSRKRRVDTVLESEPSYPYLKHYTTTTDSKGIAKIKFSATLTPDTYYAMVTAVSQGGNKATTQVIDHRVQNYGREILYDEDNFYMYKGEIKTFEFDIQYVNQYAQNYHPNIKEDYVVNVYHTYDSAQTNPLTPTITSKMVTDVYSVKSDNNGRFSFTIDGRGFYGDKSYVKIVLPATDGFKSYTSDELTLRHEWFYVNTLKALKNECANPDGCDAIILRNKEYVRDSSADTVHITRNQYIIGAKGSKYPFIDGKQNKILFEVDAGTGMNQKELTEFTLIGVQIENCDNVISQNDYTNVTLSNCVFKHNTNTFKNYQGNTILHKTSNCITTVQNCYFVNNQSNCILARGNCNISNNLFKITDVKYTIQPEPFILNQYSGKGILKNNFIYINTSMVYENGKQTFVKYPSNRSYAKIAVWVGKNAVVNGKGVRQLNGDNTFNYFDDPYNNRAYIFSIYYYPYDGVKTYIVASARGDKINKATGHAVEGTNWAWKDGYNLVRYSSNNYNTNNPYVTIKNGNIIESSVIYVPVAGGMIDLNVDEIHTTTRMG